MKLLNTICISLILFFSCIDYTLAEGKAYSMGELEAVVSSGPFNIIRNPALLILQKKENSLGISFGSITHHTYDIHSKSNIELYTTENIDVETPSLNLDIEEPKIIVTGVNIAYSIKIGQSTIGAAITESEGKNQFSLIKNNLSSYINFNSLSIQENSKETKKEFNPSFVSSIGFNISKKNSIGFQIIGTYSYYDEKTIKNKYLNNIRTERLNIKKFTKIISAETGMGYLYREKDIQLGLLIKSGKISWKKESLSYDITDLHDESTPFIDDSCRKNSNYSFICKYSSSPRIIAGGYKKINTFLGIALECEFSFNNSFIDKTLEINDENESFFIDEKIYPYRKANTILLKGGAELNPFSNMVLAFGAGYKYTLEQKASDFKENHESWTKDQFDTYHFTCGMDYIVNNNLILSFIASLIKIEGDMYLREEDPEKEIRLQIYNETSYFFMTLGLTFSF